MSLPFFTGFSQVGDCEDSFNLGHDIDFLSAMNDDKEGNKSDEVDFQCHTYIVILKSPRTCIAYTTVGKLLCNCLHVHCSLLMPPFYDYFPPISPSIS